MDILVLGFKNTAGFISGGIFSGWKYDPKMIGSQLLPVQVGRAVLSGIKLGGCRSGQSQKEDND